jgi:hypothetical protein
MVYFDHAGKISQIRLYWDQGALLKQIDVIGARSRNWPIRDSKEQARLIASSQAAVAQPEPAASSRPSTSSRGADEVSIRSRPRGATNNAMNDPHASLSLFQNRGVEEENDSNSQPLAARAQSAKPPPREYSELFVGENAGSPSPSPHKYPTKAGGGKNFKANRLFDETEEELEHGTPAVKGAGIKTNPKKYEHFTFGDGEDNTKVRNTARPETKAKSQANWDFESFNTPAKPKQKTLPETVRHFGWSDDEVGPFFQPEASEVAPLSLLSSYATLTDMTYNRRPRPSAARSSTRLAPTLILTSSSSTTAPPRVSASKPRLRVASVTRVKACTKTTSRVPQPAMPTTRPTMTTSARSKT